MAPVAVQCLVNRAAVLAAGELTGGFFFTALCLIDDIAVVLVQAFDLGTLLVEDALSFCFFGPGIVFHRFTNEVNIAKINEYSGQDRYEEDNIFMHIIIIFFIGGKVNEHY